MHAIDLDLCSQNSQEFHSSQLLDAVGQRAGFGAVVPAYISLLALLGSHGGPDHAGAWLCRVLALAPSPVQHLRVASAGSCMHHLKTNAGIRHCQCTNTKSTDLMSPKYAVTTGMGTPLLYLAFHTASCRTES